MLPTIDLISQICAATFALTAAFLMARKNKWGVIVGLANQPFWFFITIYHQQWPIFIMAIIYTAVWIYGIYNWWFNPKDKCVKEASS